MELIRRELPSGCFGQRFEPGLVDGLLNAAMTANDCVEAVAAAIAGEDRTMRQVEEARLAVERGRGTGVREGSASVRYGVACDGYEGLAREWARQAWHLARSAAGALRAVQADPAAAVTAAQVGLGEIMPVSRLYADPWLLPSPSIAVNLDLLADDCAGSAAPATSGETGDDEWAAGLWVRYWGVVEAVRYGATHAGDIRLVDEVLDPAARQSVFDANLQSVAGALHDYGAAALWQLAALTAPEHGE